ncbi:MAG: aldose epimerase family protein [Marinosulfonomonas sp.]
MEPKITVFGAAPDGEAVQQITLQNGALTAQVLTYGATVRDLRMEGVDHPLVLGHDTLDPYFDKLRYFGAIVGRFANRLSNATFSIAGKDYAVDKNFRGRHMLHGGTSGVGCKVWAIKTASDTSVTLSLELPDGDMGFPGNMTVEVTYSLPGDGALQVEISAQTDAASPCNFAHHGYFNLDGSDTITDHILQIEAEHYLPVDDDLIPTGEARAVAGTPFDFSASREIGTDGYDHNFCLSQEKGPLRRVVTLRSPKSGITLNVETNETGIQVYDGGQMPMEGLPGLDGRVYRTNAGLALEAQVWPDAPNQPGFPMAILQPGETYHQSTRYVFSKG